MMKHPTHQGTQTMDSLLELHRLTDAQRQAILCLSDRPQRARRGCGWWPKAAFRLVWPGYVKLHQHYLGDSYSLTRKGLELQRALKARATGEDA